MSRKSIYEDLFTSEFFQVKELTLQNEQTKKLKHSNS